MKMKKLWKPLILFLTLSATGTALFLLFMPQKPFRKLCPAQILSATVRLTPPDQTLLIPDVAELAAYLHDVVIYRRDDSYTDYCGQGVTFTLYMQDGTRREIMAYNPFLVIDGVGYRTKYGPCQALNSYANRLLDDGTSIAVLDEPPVLSMQSGGTCFGTLPGSYAWQRKNPDGTYTETESDSPHPLECRDLLLPFETAEPTASFEFALEPDAILSVRCWNDTHWSDPAAKSGEVCYTGDGLTLKPGGYIYEVTANWSTENNYGGGTASYYFYIICPIPAPSVRCRCCPLNEMTLVHGLTYP